MAGSSSNTTPEKVINFQVKPVLKLKDSTASLSDFHFNPDSRARIDITKQGFELTVRNIEFGVIANLLVKPSGMISFECRKEIAGKWINVAEFHEKLEEGTKKDDDFVSFSHVEGSNQMTFFFGSNPDKEHTIELKEIDEQDEIKRIPENVSCVCHANFPTDYLEQMMQHLLGSDDPNQRVSVEVEDLQVCGRIGDRDWPYTYEEHQMFPGTRRMGPLEIHIGRFIMHHFAAISKALTAAEPIFLWCFFHDDDEPRRLKGEYLTIIFFLDKLGTLAFFFTPTSLIRSPDKRTRQYR